MKEVKVQLTEEQTKFLKIFANNHHAGAIANDATENALHVVENKRYDYIPFSEDLESYYDDLPLCFTTDEDYDRWWDNEREMVLDYYAERGKACPIEVETFRELAGDSVENVYGDMVEVYNYEKYFEVYGVPLQAMAWRKIYWDKIALFFIKEEAEKYLRYQGHNLHQPRIFTYGAGYGNEGDFGPFRQLLLKIGLQLNKEEEV